MKKHIYRVHGMTKKGGLDILRLIDLEADTKAEAIKVGKALWNEWNESREPCFRKHLFHVDARRLRDDEELKWNFWHICNRADLDM